ncbi:hypothetical protein D3C80_1799640 [compost metagenome]
MDSNQVSKGVAFKWCGSGRKWLLVRFTSFRVRGLELVWIKAVPSDLEGSTNSSIQVVMQALRPKRKRGRVSTLGCLFLNFLLKQLHACPLFTVVSEQR